MTMSVSHPKPKKKMIVKSIDYDNCIGYVAALENPGFRKKYILDHPEAKDHKDLWKFFIENSPFGKLLKEQLEDKEVTEVVFTSGSNRASLVADLYNRYGNFDALGGFDGGSSFRFFQNFTEYLKELLAKTGGEKISYNARTLFDIWWKKQPTDYIVEQKDTPGYPTDFINSKKQLRENRRILEKHFQEIGPDPFFDHSKISLLYAQIHAIARDHPDTEIQYDFYDDRPEICHALYTAFYNHPELLPKNVKLNINTYDLFATKDWMSFMTAVVPRMDSFSAVPSLTIQGEGAINMNYADDVKLLHASLAANKLTHKIDRSPNEIPPGADLYFMTSLPKELHEYINQYICLEDKGKLFYVKSDGTAEEFSINFDAFIKQFHHDKKVIHQGKARLNYGEVNLYIKSNGGYEYPIDPFFDQKSIETAIVQFQKLQQKEDKILKQQLVRDKAVVYQSPGNIDQLKSNVIAEIQKYFGASDSPFFKKVMLTHRKDATELLVNVRAAQTIQDISFALLSEWEKGCNKHRGKLIEEGDPDHAMIAFLRTKGTTSYYHHILNSLIAVSDSPGYRQDQSAGKISSLDKFQDYVLAEEQSLPKPKPHE